MNDAHVFISSGENVRLSCNNALSDCKSTSWIYNRFTDSPIVGTDSFRDKEERPERHERLSLGSDLLSEHQDITKKIVDLTSADNM